VDSAARDESEERAEEGRIPNKINECKPNRQLVKKRKRGEVEIKRGGERGKRVGTEGTF